MTFVFKVDNEEVWCPPAGSYDKDPSDFKIVSDYSEISKIEFTLIDDPRIGEQNFFVDTVALYEND